MARSYRSSRSLENDCMRGSEAEATNDSSIWARTSLEALLDLIDDLPVHVAAAVRYKLTPARPGHVVVFGPDGFHLCSCLKLLRHGLLCRHIFAVLVRFLGSKFKGVLLDHRFHGNNTMSTDAGGIHLTATTSHGPSAAC